MASLSRGLLHPAASPRLFFSSTRPLFADFVTTARPRFFPSPCNLRSFASAARPVRPPPSSVTKGPKPSSTPAATAKSPSSYALVKSLATKPTPTILYEAPSQFWFYFGCWTSGISILAWTAATGPQIVFQPEGVPQFVGWVYGVSYVLLGSMGFYLISKTPNIVKTIRVLPVQAPRATAVPRPSPSPATKPLPQHQPGPQLQMEVTIHRMLPFLEPKVITTSLDKVSLTSRFSLPGEYVPELRRQQLKRTAEAQQSELMRRDMDRLFTMPFRRMGRAFAAMFRGVRSAWTDMGYGGMVVEGKRCKVNIAKGFAHDGFRTLERIVPIKAK